MHSLARLSLECESTRMEIEDVVTRNAFYSEKNKGPILCLKIFPTVIIIFKIIWLVFVFLGLFVQFC